MNYKLIVHIFYNTKISNQSTLKEKTSVKPRNYSAKFSTRKTVYCN